MWSRDSSELTSSKTVQTPHFPRGALESAPCQPGHRAARTSSPDVPRPPPSVCKESARSVCDLATNRKQQHGQRTHRGRPGLPEAGAQGSAAGSPSQALTPQSGHPSVLSPRSLGLRGWELSHVIYGKGVLSGDVGGEAGMHRPPGGRGPGCPGPPVTFRCWSVEVNSRRMSWESRVQLQGGGRGGPCRWKVPSGLGSAV